MSAEPKLPRWTEPGSDAPDELSALLRAGRAPLGTPEEVAQLAQGLGQLLSPAAAGLSATSLAAPAASAGLGLVRWSVWAAAGLSGAAALWYLSADSAPPPAPSSPPPAAQVQPAPPVLAPPGVVVPPLVDAPPLVEPEARPPASAKPARPQRAPAGSSEVELLRRAQAALGTQPARALALTNEHERRFRGGALAEEREALAIEALRRLGRTQEAQRRTVLFQRRYPDSVHASRVRGSAAPPTQRPPTELPPTQR